MKTLTIFFCFFLIVLKSGAQCPPNIDFELGDFSHWQCFIGKTYASSGKNTIQLDTCQPISGRHEIISSKTDLDYYGNFPQLCPFGGNYSIKLGNEFVGSEAEGLSYTFTVPTTVDTFTFTYFYAVVFENPGHSIEEQPRFFVTAYEVATGNIINCAAFDYVSTGSLPGFNKSSLDPTVLYKNWTPASLQFAGLKGKEVRLEFRTADCTRGGHFGYAYVDVASGCSNILATAPYCIQTNSLTLNAPYGFKDYLWYDSSLTKLIGQGQSIILSPPPVTAGSFFVDVIPYPGFGCRDTFEAKVKPLSIPNLPSCPSDYYYCQYQSTIPLTAFADSGNILQWYYNDSTSVPSSINPSPSTVNSGDFVYYVSQKQLFGCEGYKKKIVVHVQGQLKTQLNIIGSDRQCLKGNKFVFNSTTINANSTFLFQWDFGDYDTLTIHGDTTISHTYASSGIYTIKLKVTTPSGCVETRYQKVYVIQNPISAVGYNSPICEQQTTLNIYDKSYSTSWVSPITNWWWNINGNIITTSTVNSFIPVTDDTIHVKLVVSTSEGCASDTSVEKIIVYPMPVAKFNISAPLCNNTFTIFTDTSYIPNPTKNSYINKWYWLANSTNSYNLQNPSLLMPAGGNAMQLEVQSNQGCKSLPVNISFNVNPKPLLNLSISDSCVYKTISYVVKDTLTNTKEWLWNFGSGWFKGSPFQTNVFNQAGNNSFSVMAKNSNDCYDTLVRNFLIYDNKAFAGYDTIAAKGEPVQLNANGYPGEKYYWTPSRGLNNDTVENPVATYDYDQLYKLHSITKEGCVSDSKIFIKRYKGPELYVPTAFSPNGDGLNDILHVFPVGIREFHYFSIYNRLGELIFKTTDKNVGWDGYYNGKRLTGTFVAVAEAIDYKGNKMLYKGTVVLLN